MHDNANKVYRWHPRTRDLQRPQEEPLTETSTVHLGSNNRYGLTTMKNASKSKLAQAGILLGLLALLGIAVWAGYPGQDGAELGRAKEAYEAGIRAGLAQASRYGELHEGEVYLGEEVTNRVVRTGYDAVPLQVDNAAALTYSVRNSADVPVDILVMTGSQYQAFQVGQNYTWDHNCSHVMTIRTTTQCAIQAGLYYVVVDYSDRAVAKLLEGSPEVIDVAFSHVLR